MKVEFQNGQPVPATFCVNPAATQDFQQLCHLLGAIFEIIDDVVQYNWRLAL